MRRVRRYVLRPALPPGAAGGTGQIHLARRPGPAVGWPSRGPAPRDHRGAGGGGMMAAEPRRVRVLVADDSEPVLMATRDLVKEFPGVEVVSPATNVADAVRLTVGYKPDLAL